MGACTILYFASKAAFLSPFTSVVIASSNARLAYAFFLLAAETLGQWLSFYLPVILVLIISFENKTYSSFKYLSIYIIVRNLT